MKTSAELIKQIADLEKAIDLKIDQYSDLKAKYDGLKFDHYHLRMKMRMLQDTIEEALNG